MLYNQTLKEVSGTQNDVVLFGDSVHPSQQTRPSYGWIKKGKDHIIETIGGRKRVNLMGVINLETMQCDYKDFETINAEAADSFLQKIEESYPKAEKIHLIWDQAEYHTAEEVKKYIKTSRIRVHYLQLRSPNLNSIERLWKIMHEYVSNNQTYSKFSNFKEKLFDFFDTVIPNIKEILVNRITDNFRVLNSSINSGE